MMVAHLTNNALTHRMYKMGLELRDSVSFCEHEDNEMR